MAKSTKKTYVDDIAFDSATEAEFYTILKTAKQENRIKNFEISIEYILQEEFKNWRGKKELAIKHYPDYLVTLNDGSKIVLDTKGSSQHETDAKIKRKMWMSQHQDIPYIYISKCPKFIGGKWVESTPYYDFNKKLRNRYDKLYPNVNKRLKDAPQLLMKDWDKWFKFHGVAGLFYVMDKEYTKKELEKM